MSYLVGFKDLKFLVDGFADGEYMTREGAVNWVKQNKSRITPEFMQRIRESPDAFFYQESHKESGSLDFLDIEKTDQLNDLIKSLELL